MLPAGVDGTDAVVWEQVVRSTDADAAPADRPATGSITQPDRWSVVVAVLAGVAGVLSLTSARWGRWWASSSR